MYIPLYYSIEPYKQQHLIVHWFHCRFNLCKLLILTSNSHHSLPNYYKDVSRTMYKD